MIKIENEKEKVALEKLKLKVDDLQQDDLTLLRFLKARNHDLAKSEDMLRASIKWRTELDVKSYLTWEAPKELRDDYIFEYTGLDYDGCPVIWAPFGRWNCREMVAKGLKEDSIKFRYHMLESLMEFIRKSERHQIVMIVGNEELSYWKVANLETTQLWFAAFKDFEANYPEILKICFTINSPRIFAYVFNFLKPCLSGTTVSKVHIFDSDKKKYLPVLRKVMPDSAIPPDYLE